MNDPQIHGTIEALVAEEHELWQRESAGAASEADRERLREVRSSLDQCWDLLRQRRALREAGLDRTPPPLGMQALSKATSSRRATARPQPTSRRLGAAP